MTGANIRIALLGDADMIEALIERLSLDSSAEELNAGIRDTKKPYVFFAEDKAKIADGYLDKLVGYLESHPEVPMAQGLIKVNSKKPLSLMGPYVGKQLVFDANEDFSQAMLFPHGLVVRTQLLKDSGICFDPSFKFVRNEAFSLLLSGLYPQRWLDGTCVYQAKKKFDEISFNGPQTTSPDWYWESTAPLVSLLQKSDGSLSKANQFALTYMASNRFRSNRGSSSKAVFDGADDTMRYLRQVSDLLELVGNDVLFARVPMGSFIRYDRYVFATLRNGMKSPDVDVIASDGKAHVMLSGENPPVEVYAHDEHGIGVQNLNIIKEDGVDYLKFDIRYMSVARPDQYQLVCRHESPSGSHETVFQPTERFSGATIYFDEEVILYTSFVAKVPLSSKREKQTISLLLRVEGQDFPLPFKYLNIWNARLTSTKSDASYWSIPGYIVRDKAGVVCLDPASKLQKMKQELSYWGFLKESGVAKRFRTLRKAYWLTRPYFKGKRIWVYYDKVFKAGDNADFAYAYAMKQNDGIEKYYYLDPSSTDWDRLEKAGYKLLVPKTFKADLYALNAELLYVTHNPGLNRIGFKPADENIVKGIFDPTCIRLFHGFPNNRNQTYNQTYQNYSGVVVCSEYERQLYESPANGYSPDQIIPCSNPRYDELVPDNQRWLVFAPTWRPNLRGKVNKDHSSAYNPKFKDSRYFRMYNKVLTDEKFLETARRTGYKVKIFLHPRMAPQTCDFENNDVVQGLDSTKDMTYVEMMRKADLMVTDYSSVQYDFASMHKPVVYYHDPNLPYWRVVEFDYESLGFGEVCKDPQELIDALCGYMERNCELSDKYKKRIDDFFLKPNGTASRELYDATRKIVG